MLEKITSENEQLYKNNKDTEQSCGCIIVFFNFMSKLDKWKVKLSQKYLNFWTKNFWLQSCQSESTHTGFFNMRRHNCYQILFQVEKLFIAFSDSGHVMLFGCLHCIAEN